jgi:hypothetical protein
MDPPHALLLVVDEERLRVSCDILLDEVDPAETRMVGRLRVRFGAGPALFVYRLLFDPGDFIMMRKMFLGIKERAEATKAAAPPHGPADGRRVGGTRRDA